MKDKSKHWKVKRNAFWATVRKMKIQPRSVILFKAGTITIEGLEEFGKAVQTNKIPDVILLVVEDVNEVRALNEQEMNKHGWYKTNTLNKLMLKREAEKSAEEAKNGETDQG